MKPTIRSPKFLYLVVIRSVVPLLFSFAFSLDLIYYYEQVQMDALQLVLVGTMLEFSVLLFEIPTGVVADLYGRKPSIIIGFFLVGIGLGLQGVIAEFWNILVCQVIWGVGVTFLSGAVEAWLSDEVGEQHANDLIIQGTRPEQIFSIAGIALAAMVMPFNMRLPLLLGGIGFLIVTLFLWVMMPEKGFQPSRQKAEPFWQQMKATVVGGMKEVRRRPNLRWILLLSVFLAIYTEGFDRLWIPFAMDSYDFGVIGPERMIGGAHIIGKVLIFFLLGSLHKRVNLADQRVLARTITVIIFLLFVALIGAVATPWLAAALTAMVLASMLREVLSPMYATWVNYRLRPETRATVLSLSGQMDAVGQILGGPAIGGVARRFSKRVGLGFSVLLLTPAMWLITRKRIRESDPV
ncbi:MAG TPA: MFS transporter [Chloroflexi bacterium]|nr:MFS transporter [Chloroflexota bacterium]